MTRLASVFLLSASLTFGANIGGKLAPDGSTEIQLDLPGATPAQHRRQRRRRAMRLHVELLENFRDWMKRHPGGGYPERVTLKINQIAKEKGIAPPRYIQIEGGREVLDVLRAALASGRMPAVTYFSSPTKRYGGQRIAHMVSLVHRDAQFACVLDNNYPGVDKYEWMSAAEFLRAFTGGRSGWAVVLLDAGPPPLPWN